MKALVTGAGKRLGRHMAEALGARGAHVFLHYQSSVDGAREAARLIEAAGGRASLGQADLSDLVATRRLVDEAVETMGGLDLLVASAGSFDRGTARDTSDEDLARSLGLIVQSSFALAQQAAPSLEASGGSIVFITCTSTARPFRGYLAYSVAKAALKQLTLALAQDLAPRVRVNAIAPGTVLPPDDTSEEQRSRYERQALLGRLGSPDDIVRALMYLIDSPFVTAQEIRVDGGRL